MTDAASAVGWLLDQADSEARRVAVRQIAKVEGREASLLLVRALGDEDWRVRKEATLTAPMIERRQDVVASLVAALEDAVNIGLRNAAVEALVAIGPDAVGATIEACRRLDSDARKLAAEVLGGVSDVRGTTALVRMLGDEDLNVRVTAAEALGNASLAGEASRAMAAAALVSELDGGDTFLKLAALGSLARLDARLPWSVFEAHVDDPILRRQVIAAAARSREPAAVRALARATGDASPTVAREAIIILGELIAESSGERATLECARAALAKSGVLAGASARRVATDVDDSRGRAGALLVIGLLGEGEDVPTLIDALGDDDVAERADLALRLVGTKAERALLAAASAGPPRGRIAALTLVASLDGVSVSRVRTALRKALDDSSPEVVQCAVEALGSRGDARDLRRMGKRVRDGDERVAATAARSVSELAARHVEAARVLVRSPTCWRDSPMLGCILLGAIASTQPLREADVQLLQRALANPQPEVRRAAIEALAQGGGGGGEAAADAVVFALADEEHEVKLAAARALGRLGRTEPLIGVVGDARDPALAAAALRALGDADPEQALAAARPLVMHPDAALACAAVEAIGQIGSGADGRVSAHVVAASEDALFAALDHPDREVVKLSLSIVAAQPGARALARMGLCLDHSSWEVRRVAAELLGQDPSPGANALLLARYERERDPNVRAAIATATSVRPPDGPPPSSDRARDGTGSKEIA